MIKAIGARRFLILLILLAVNVAVGALVYTYMMPQKIKQDRALRVAQSETQVLRGDINQLQVDMQQFDQNKAAYDAIYARGFLLPQDRRRAEEYFRDAQSKSKVVSVAASIKAGVVEDHEAALKANYKVLNSPIVVVIKAVDDTVIHQFLRDIQYDFNGHISLVDMHIRRTADVTGTVLRAISNGTSPELAEAKLVFQWRSLIPDSAVISDGQGGV